MKTFDETKILINQGLKARKSKRAIFDSLKHDYSNQDELIEMIRFSVTTKQKTEYLFYNVFLIGLIVASIVIKLLGVFSEYFNAMSIINILISCIIIYGLIQYKKWAFQLIIWFGIIVSILLIITSLDVKFDILKFVLTIISVLFGTYLKGSLFPKPIIKKVKNENGVDELSVNFKD